MSWRADLIAPREQMISGELVLPADPGQGIVLDDAAVAAHRAD